ncbi:sulfatase, partial [Bacteroidota bacterium]
MKKLVLWKFLILGLLVNAQNEQPNILWIVCEDISPTLSFYGDSTAKTPNLDALAKESLIFDNAFTPVGVCAPSRSSIITGMHPTSIGTMHMRTGKDVMSWGKRTYNRDIEVKDLKGNAIRQYAVVVPAEVKCFPEYLRANGYFCTNNQKTDYQFAAPVTAWDQNYGRAHWRNSPKNKPFFSVFNIDLTHESKLWKHEKLPLTVAKKSVPVPPYLPNTEISRKTIAKNYSNIELMDKKVGSILRQLKEDGLYDNTIVFFYSDHGGPLPRQKREILDSGLKVPFMIKFLNSTKKGRTDRLISFVDLAPTILSLAKIKPSKYFEGEAFLGNYEGKEREYVYGSSDRFDEYSDRIRSVRNKRYLYLKNDYPKLTKYKDVGYRKSVPMMQNILDLKNKGTLDSIQNKWFATKDVEELYDCVEDPHNLHNLAKDSNYE